MPIGVQNQFRLGGLRSAARISYPLLDFFFARKLLYSRGLQPPTSYAYNNAFVLGIDIFDI